MFDLSAYLLGLALMALMALLAVITWGVSVARRDIGNRRPKYRDYIAPTPTFFPGPPRPVPEQQDSQ